MNVPKILEVLPFVRFILRHLKLSEISTVMLNDALEGLDMKVTNVMFFFSMRLSYS